ncbi:MAG: metal-dependent hydrolase [Planctomycetota bacterium]|jgi:membrane-bound metal-dependent hydrolase YbcI (DUF457 family)
MKAFTHSIFGALTIEGVCLLMGANVRPELFAVAAIASIMPDVDLPMSGIGRLFKPLSERIYKSFGHRSITHSVVGVFIVAILFLPLRLLSIPYLYTSAALGFASHLMLDMANTEGIELSYPTKHRWVFPANPTLRFPSGHPIEKAIRVILGVMIGLLLIVQSIGTRTILHRVMGTPEAASTEYFQQLLENRKTIIQVSGIWTKSQGVINDDVFEVVAITDNLIFVRRLNDIKKLYTIGRGANLSISKARIKRISNIEAEQRIVTVSFDNEPWKDDLALRFPNSLVSGRVNTKAFAPTFTIDEFQTIQKHFDYLEFTHAPIELVDKYLTNQILTGTLHIRYWKRK